MNRKVILFCIGAIVGVLVAFSAARLLNARRSLDIGHPTASVVRTGIPNPSDVGNQLPPLPTAQESESPPKAAKAESASADVIEKDDGGFLAKALAGGLSGKDGIMQKMVMAAVRSQLDNQIQELTTELKLTPDQQKQIRSLMEQDAEKGIQATLKALQNDGATAPPPPAPSESLDAEIQKLLSPSQREAYSSWKASRDADGTSQMVQFQMNQIRKSIDLTDSQAEAVQKRLAVSAPEILEGVQSGQGGLPDLELLMKRQLEALEGIVSAEKLTEFQEQRERELKLLKQFFPKTPQDTGK